MPLYQRLSTDGNWLFRWRSYLPVSVVVAGLFLHVQQQNIHHDTITAESLEIVGILISAIGLLIRCLVVDTRRSALLVETRPGKSPQV